MAILKVLLIAIPVIGFYLYRRLKWLRFEQYKGYPAPQSDLIWGHMKLINETMSDPTKIAGRHSGQFHMYSKVTGWAANYALPPVLSLQN